MIMMMINDQERKNSLTKNNWVGWTKASQLLGKLCSGDFQFIIDCQESLLPRLRVEVSMIPFPTYGYLIFFYVCVCTYPPTILARQRNQKATMFFSFLLCIPVRVSFLSIFVPCKKQSQIEIRNTEQGSKNYHSDLVTT